MNNDLRVKLAAV